MKIPSALLALALATVAAAQSPSLPTCAKGCADQFISNGIGNCNLDAKCICSDKDFISNISCCVAGACNPADQQSAVAFAAGICNGVGITVPTTVACSTTSAPTSTSTTAGNATGGAVTTTSSKALGPRQTAAAGLGALGGFVAAVAML